MNRVRLSGRSPHPAPSPLYYWSGLQSVGAVATAFWHARNGSHGITPEAPVDIVRMRALVLFMQGTRIAMWPGRWGRRMTMRGWCDPMWALRVEGAFRAAKYPAVSPNGN